MGSSTKAMGLSGFAQRLVNEALLDENSIRNALNDALAQKTPFIIYLVEKNFLPSHVIAMAAAHHFGVPLLDINAFDEELIPSDLVNAKLINKHHALPLFKRDNNLFIAVSDPANLPALYEIKFHTGLNTHTILVEHDKLIKKIDGVLNAKESASLGDLTDANLEFSEIADDELEDDKDRDQDDAPIVRFVNTVLLDAIKKRASDIHFEPYEKKYRVRLRLDGILYEVATPPVSLSNRIATRLKVMSKLDISDRRIPQDGHFRLKLSVKSSIDFRVSTCPTVGGEKIVLRILDSTSSTLTINDLGYEDRQRDLFETAIHKPHGMVLVTGPTGSGKTVSLYTALHVLNTPERNISTVEDPVEINIHGVNQVHINTKAGLTFSTALRSFLRQDPDVIMVGEIRDLETAEIAIKAAQTGHLVLSTLHTNSTADTLSRLINMGVPSYNLASSINLIIAQRLARRLCVHCKKPAEIPKTSLIEQGFTEEEADSITLFDPVGCESCTNGYSGRIGIYEVLHVTESISHIIMEGANALEINEQAGKEGLQLLRRSGLNKVMEGVTSLDEINRITKD